MQEEKKRRIALDSIRLPTAKEVIEKNKISKTTLFNLKKDPEFKRLLIEARAEIWESVIDDISRNAGECVQVLLDTMKDKKTPPTARIKAAKAILDYGAEYYDNVRILRRIEELEEYYRQENEEGDAFWRNE